MLLGARLKIAEALFYVLLQKLCVMYCMYCVDRVDEYIGTIQCEMMCVTNTPLRFFQFRIRMKKKILQLTENQNAKIERSKNSRKALAILECQRDI